MSACVIIVLLMFMAPTFCIPIWVRFSADLSKCLDEHKNNRNCRYSQNVFAFADFILSIIIADTHKAVMLADVMAFYS